MTTLKELLASRQGRLWEPLTTAAGVATEVAVTEQGLIASELAKGAFGKSEGPSIIRGRVEALAAYDPQRLGRVAQEWIAPKEIRGNWWWISAWNTSLRHLQLIDAVQRRAVDVPELAEEVAILWPDRAEGLLSWEDAVHALEANPHNQYGYEHARRLHTLLQVRRPLSASMLGDAPLGILRLIRGWTHMLDQSARQSIVSAAEQCLDDESDRSPFRAAMLIELAGDIAPDVLSEIEQRFIGRLLKVWRPETAAPIAFTLLGNWIMP